MIDNSTVLKITFFLLTITVTLIFGLYPKDFDGGHTPYINSVGDLRFTKYSVATAQVDLKKTSEISATERIFLDVSLKINSIPSADNRFSVIFSINDIQGNSQLLLGQWQDYLVIMSGDDYSNQDQQPRITVPLKSVHGYVFPQPVNIEIKAYPAATTVTINGVELVKSTLYVPPLESETYIVSLGNTLNRKQGWVGSLSEFDLRLSVCQLEKITKNAFRCSASHSAELNNILTATTTEAQNLEKALHRSTFVMQPPFTVLNTRWLSSKSMQHWFTSGFNKDIVINLLGFIPVTLAIFFLATTKFRSTAAAVLTISATILLSLFIESVQIFIPSRTSSVVDLSINSFSGVSTTVLCYIALRSKRLAAKLKRFS